MTEHTPMEVVEDPRITRNGVVGDFAAAGIDTTETGPEQISSRFARELSFRCPGPAPRGIFDPPRPCMEPLPCTVHNVPDPYVGVILYGSYYLERTQ